MSGLFNKAKEALSKSGSNTGNTSTQTTGAGNEDYVDKGFAAIQKQTGFKQSRETNEKITDAGRSAYEKATGSKVDSKVC